MTSLLDTWLGKIYQADIKNNRAALVSEFKGVLGADAALMTAAKDRLVYLDALIKKRGEKACAYSSKYRIFLQEALA